MAIADAEAAERLCANSLTEPPPAQDEQPRTGPRLAQSDGGSERRRIARELHDETLQVLAGLRIRLSAALRTGRPDELAIAVEATIAGLDQEIEELRRLVEGLRPIALEALGVEGAIRALGEAAANADGCAVETRIDADVPLDRLDADIQHALYRVVQEALANVVKHAHATRAVVDLRVCDAHAELRVADDGRGIGARRGRHGLGLAGLRERVQELGGQFEVAGSRSGGTIVRACVGLRPDPEEPKARRPAKTPSSKPPIGGSRA